MTRRALIAFVIISLATFPAVLQAEELEAGRLHKPNAFEFGLMYHHFDYEEEIPPPGKSTEKGCIPGLYLGYAYNKKDNVHTEIFMEFSSGDVDYDGTTQGGTPIRFSDNPQDLFRFEWDIGYTLDAGEDLSFAPYTGYGYRYWERGEAKIASTYWSYREEYTWHYIPVGFKANFRVGDKWSIGADMAVRFMFGGEMTAYLSEVYPDLSDPTFDLDSKAGWFTEMPVAYKVSEGWSLVGTPWYEHSEIGKSRNVSVRYRGTVIGQAYEPASETNQYGIKIGMIYSF